jgi:HicB_like antitoxin of bacterial toxin-antitoxin system
VGSAISQECCTPNQFLGRRRDRGQPTRANISLDRGLLEAIDQAAATRGLTRSAFLASAAREKIANEG